MDSTILRFALMVGLIGVVLAGALFAAAFYPIVKHWKTINQRALALIKCNDSRCDTTDFASDWNTELDYVIEIRNRYVISALPSFVVTD